MPESKVQEVTQQGGYPEIDRHLCVRGRVDLGTAHPQVRPHGEGEREVRRHHREAGRPAWSPISLDLEATQLGPSRPAACRPCPGPGASPAVDRRLERCKA